MKARIVGDSIFISLNLFTQVGGYKPPSPIPKTQSAFHPPAQRNAFRGRDVRLQSRSFAPLNQELIRC